MLDTMKVLDVQWGKPKMPEVVKNFFFEYFDKGNDVWVEYSVGQSSEELDEGVLSILDSWLIRETCLVLGENVLLRHWW